MDNDDLIGVAKVSINDLENREEKDLWLEIEPVRPEKASHKVRELVGMPSQYKRIALS